MSKFRISVSDPQKIGEGYSAYVSYKLTSSLSEKIQGLDAQVYSVIRRFNDFSWLRSQLREALPYLIVPALPEKQQIGRFSEDFIAVRHRALQRWVDRISVHPEITSTDAFRKFISFPAEALSSLREGNRTEQAQAIATEGTKTIMKIVKSAAIQVKDAISQARGNAATGLASSGSSSVEDMSFSELELYLIGQAPLLTALYNESASVAVRAREQAQLLLDFGAAMRALGQSESSEVGTPANVGTSTMAVGLASWASSTAAYEKAVCETELFVEKLADYVRGTRSVKECLDARTKASSELTEARDLLERLRAQSVALASAPPTPTSGKEKVQNEIDLAAAQKTSADARVFYDKCAAGVIAETERLRTNMRTDFKLMLLDFVSIQVRTEMKLAQAWEKIREEVNKGAVAEGVIVNNNNTLAIDSGRIQGLGGNENQFGNSSISY